MAIVQLICVSNNTRLGILIHTTIKYQADEGINVNGNTLAYMLIIIIRWETPAL